MDRVVTRMLPLTLIAFALSVVTVRSQSSTDIIVIGAEPRPAPGSAPGVVPAAARPVVPTPGSITVLEKPEHAPVLTEGKAPIGSIMAWAKSMPKTPELPSGWVECNGQEIKELGSPYAGQMAPNLNGVDGQPRRFLRGGSGSGATGGSTEHNHGGTRSQKYGDSRKPVGDLGNANHLPPYFEVVWIMRVK